MMHTVRSLFQCTVLSHAAFFNTRPASPWVWADTITIVVVSLGNVFVARSQQWRDRGKGFVVGNAHRRGHGQPWATRAAISAVTCTITSHTIQACGQTNHPLCLPWPRKGKFPQQQTCPLTCAPPAVVDFGGHKAGWCTDARLVVMASEVTEVGGHEKCTAIDGRWRVQRLTLLAYFLLISSSIRSSRSSEKCDGITRATSLISASTNMAVIHRGTLPMHQLRSFKVCCRSTASDLRTDDQQASGEQPCPHNASHCAMPSREVACEMEVGAAMESAAACLRAFVLRTYDVRPPPVKDLWFRKRDGTSCCSTERLVEHPALGLRWYCGTLETAQRTSLARCTLSEPTADCGTQAPSFQLQPVSWLQGALSAQVAFTCCRPTEHKCVHPLTKYGRCTRSVTFRQHCAGPTKQCTFCASSMHAWRVLL